ncbi:TVP38/TMEM64 family protein [Geodermatophilus normandii]|uniref:TVP38/TMEM64 family protein n=1 Tax=Geodermatophilus normandii TaxID=1137989 RepID=UPI000D710620|nr:VTT domain-containing protein [Geodermatophilus normandii]
MRTSWLRAGALLAVLAAGTVVALTVELPDVDAVRRWVAGAGAPGLVLLALATGALLVGPVPRMALCVLLGVVLGFWTGLAVSLAGGMLGALAAFGLSRWLGRETVVRLAGPRLAAVDRAVAGRGFVAVLVGRLLPVVPFSALSHAAGLSAVPLGAYAAGTALGLVPGTVLQVGVGASVPELTAWAARAGSPLMLAVVTAVSVTAAAVVRLRRRGTGAVGACRAGPVHGTSPSVGPEE